MLYSFPISSLIINVLNKSSKVGELLKNVSLIDELHVKGQLQRFYKLSLFDRFRYVENGLDINF